jgi:hypothetical protein
MVFGGRLVRAGSVLMLGLSSGCGGDRTGDGGAGGTGPSAGGSVSVGGSGGGGPSGGSTSGGSGEGGSSGGRSSEVGGSPADLPGDDRLLGELTTEEGATLCISWMTPESLIRRCDARAVIETRGGTESDYTAACPEVRDACTASRDGGSFDAECQGFPFLTEPCAVTVGQYRECTLALVESAGPAPSCSWSYAEAQAYVVGPPPDLSKLPECRELAECYESTP